MASVQILKGGGGAIRNRKNPGINIYSGFKKNAQGGGGVQFVILKKIQV